MDCCYSAQAMSLLLSTYGAGGVLHLTFDHEDDAVVA